MNQQLFEDARNGETTRIVPNLQFDPEKSEWTPLHIACLFGKENFTRVFLVRNPEFLKLKNPDGCTALHLACSNGYLEIVQFLLKFNNNGIINRELCLKKDKNGKNSLHYAVVKNDFYMVMRMLKVCPESALDLTDKDETVFHLAVKNRVTPSSGVLALLLDGPYAGFLLNLGDKNGDTVLHLGIVRKQIEIIGQVLRTAEESRLNLEVNTVNSNGLTPLDVLVVDPMSETDIKIEKMLISAGGIRLNESNEQRENIKSITSGLLVMASFTAATSIQIGIYLQGSFWENSDFLSKNRGQVSNYTQTSQLSLKKYLQYKTFEFFDSLLLLSSLCLVLIVLFPNRVKDNLIKWKWIRLLTYVIVPVFMLLFFLLPFNKDYWGRVDLFYFLLLPFVHVIFTLIAIPCFRFWRISKIDSRERNSIFNFIFGRY